MNWNYELSNIEDTYMRNATPPPSSTSSVMGGLVREYSHALSPNTLLSLPELPEEPQDHYPFGNAVARSPGTMDSTAGRKCVRF